MRPQAKPGLGLQGREELREILLYRRRGWVPHQRPDSRGPQTRPGGVGFSCCPLPRRWCFALVAWWLVAPENG